MSVDLPLLALALLTALVLYLIVLRGRLVPSTAAEQVTPAKKRVDTEARVPHQPESADEDGISYFLVVDVEGTCVPDTSDSKFNWPNEIIEWPVVLLRWSRPQSLESKPILEVVDEFQSYVRPVWSPKLHTFCTELTGITQKQVDQAPTFPEVMNEFEKFLIRHKLISTRGEVRLKNFVWCTDGPWDIRDFVTKQIHISNMTKPWWLEGRVLDVRQTFGEWYIRDIQRKYRKSSSSAFGAVPSFKLSRQLELLQIGPFQGREHSGIDDTRNISRILVELSRREFPLQPNLDIVAPKWAWMGPNGTVRGDF